MPPRPHPRHRRRAAPYQGFDSITYITELVPEPDEFYFPVAVVLDKKNDAGDLLPTIVMPDSARKYIDQVDADYTRENLAITQSNVDPAFKAQWLVQFGAWKTFSVAARASVGFFDTKAVMDQTDRFAQQLVDQDKAFAAAGGARIGAPPATPGQGVGEPVALSSVTKLVAALAGVAAIVIIGPKLFK